MGGSFLSRRQPAQHVELVPDVNAEFCERISINSYMARSPGSALSLLPRALESESSDRGWQRMRVRFRGSRIPATEGGFDLCRSLYLRPQFWKIGMYLDYGGGWKLSEHLVYSDVLSLEPQK